MTGTDFQDQLSVFVEHAHCWPRLQSLALSGEIHSSCYCNLHKVIVDCGLVNTDAPSLSACLQHFPNLLSLDISGSILRNSCVFATDDVTDNQLGIRLPAVLESLRHTRHIQELNVESLSCWSRHRKIDTCAGCCHDNNMLASALAAALRGHLHELHTLHHRIRFGKAALDWMFSSLCYADAWPTPDLISFINAMEYCPNIGVKHPGKGGFSSFVASIY